MNEFKRIIKLSESIESLDLSQKNLSNDQVTEIL